MKFLCPQCKAKYQIADDKIDGRTLRMKCRRCEHEIVVKGDVDAAGAEAAEPRAGGARTAEGAGNHPCIVPYGRQFRRSPPQNPLARADWNTRF